MFFLFIVLLIIIFLVTSTIQIKIENFKYNTESIKIKTIENKKNYINDKCNIQIKLLVLNKIPIIWSNINNSKIKKLQRNEKLKKIKYFKKNNKKVAIKQIKQAKNIIEIYIKKFELNAYIGTDSTLITSFIITVISSFLAIMFVIKRVNYRYVNYNIKPIYNKRKYTKCRFFWYI